MEPKIVKHPAMILVGMVVSGKSVKDIDILGLWQRFVKNKRRIHGAVMGKAYEMHIEEDDEPRLHMCFIGLEVKKIKDLPVGMFAKTIPAGRYALFTHSFKEGGFNQAFKNVYGWLKNSKYRSAHHFDLQCYDKRYKGYDKPQSVIEILVPVKKK